MVRAPQNGRHSFYCSRAGGENLGSGCLAEIVRREFDGMNFVPKNFRLFYLQDDDESFLINDWWIMMNSPFQDVVSAFFLKKNETFISLPSLVCLPNFSELIVSRNSTNQKSRHVLGTDQYIAPEAYEGPCGKMCFFSKTACKKGRKMVQGFWWSCLLFKMLGNLAKPFFLENPFKKDGSKDYPKRLQSCENYWSFGRLLLWVIMNHIFSDKGCSETRWNLHVWWWSIFKHERHICM